MTIQNRITVNEADFLDGLRDAARILPSPDAPHFADAFESFGDARVVLLGEATHGTHEFYAARAAITRRLIEKHGFNIVAVEGDWPDVARIDAYARHRAARPRKGEPFVRFPTWMWRNEEVLSFADWLRGHNETLPDEQRAGLYGLDVYSLGESIHAVIAYLDAHDEAAAAEARRRYACLMPWQDEPQHYGRAVEHGTLRGCEDAVVAQLEGLLAERMDYIRQDGEAFFDAEQNARIVRAAEQYYRAMYRGSAASWNQRDRHMFDTLLRLMAHRKDARAVVWAHNSHVGNASATAMGWHGEFNIGELCRAAFGNEAVLIGFGMDRGTVAAASDWGADMRVMQVRPARDDSWEAAFRRTGHARSLTDWRRRKDPRLVEMLSQTLLERAIGVVYRPETERASHYFEAILADQFDAFVWFEQTRAVTPLGHERPHGAPETWPFGL
ncbi:erythromycin esterase family protein [Novosphingobium pentaromativorans]|uniref:Putative erythromycin esterase protein n=1 Tax=Novosphingobium pentaromativorans US6-1 TaxID=1088721 RepID=G6EFP7_9SPHN|nr:erythromycin esterase family protein [Novosphingobium pentaromativorans]AIT81829.1 carboxylic ester hydrolase [Novosphingobium pentaromativorans US6-1]EHJ59877.1 putative erythromycin esterase protein [Novosphingobium pentaromativorans US6-1]